MTRTRLLATAAAALLLGATSAQGQAPPATPLGYRLGDPALARSPVSLAEFELLQRTVLFGEDDIAALRQAGVILGPQTDAILDVWYGFVGSHPHLLRFFSNPRTGVPEGAYLARVRARFARWITDTTDANYNQAWLDWQHEIGVRHTSAGKNRTDRANAVPQVDLRYMIAFIVPISATIRPFLEVGGAPREAVDRMQAAWTKAVVLHTILWTRPYLPGGVF